MAYCTAADLLEFGVADTFDESVLTSAADIATSIVDGYTGRTFTAAGSRTITVNDVRNPLVRIPGPIGTITSVTVNGAEVAASGYTVEDWGLRLYSTGAFDVDGFPVAYSSVRGGRGPYGAKVEVTATFGYSSVPVAVKRATVLIAEDVLKQGSYNASTALDEEGNVSVLPEIGAEPTKSLYDTDTRDSTGNEVADRLLMPFRVPMVG